MSRSSDMFSAHINRLRVGASYSDNLAAIPKWLEDNTFINGKSWSFKDHEWQLGPLQSKMPEQCIIKPSQIGASEISIRLALARVAIMRSYTLLYVLPSAHFARTFAKTRADAVIQESQYLSDAVDREINSSEIKKFGTSYIYFRGCSTGSQAVSIPASCIVADETCFGDQDILSAYTSRLTHSIHRHRVSLSTPTLPGYAIHEDFLSSRRHYRMYKCCHCGSWHWFDFFRDVRVPDAPEFNLRGITPTLLMKYPQYRDAYITCPTCGKQPDLGPEYREWVVENNDYTGNRDGFHASPVDVPRYNTPGYMIEAATRYNLREDWMNNTLGLPAQSSDTTLCEEDVRKCIIDHMPSTSHSYVMGLDLGLESYCVIAAVLPDGTLIIVHTEAIPLGQLVDRRQELERKYRCRVSVCDSQPYVESVHRMQKTSPNLYAAVYVKNKSVETHTMRLKEEHKDKGGMDLKMVMVNRDRSFDVLMEAVRAQEILKVSDDDDDLWVAHAIDMKRVKTFDKDNELSVTWAKSKLGADHLWHATLYAFTASRILGISSGYSGGALPLLSTFRVLPQKSVV